MALKEIFYLFFPQVCPVCGKNMNAGSSFMCTECMYEMPLTGFTSRIDNPVVEKFWGLIPIVNACSYFWFVNESGYRRMIHAFKYYGGWKLARQLGEMFGEELEDGGLYGDVDVIIPIPLHFVRQLNRGYNQSEYIADGISVKLNRPLIKRCVTRHRYNKSQAQKHKSERWDNVEGIFSVRQPEQLAGKHILLVDDVLTTGATIVSCAEAILRVVPDCRISIATLAVSKSDLTSRQRKSNSTAG